MSLFNFLGIRFGWSSVIGLIPAAGDALDAFMAFMVYRTCCQVESGLPSAVNIYLRIGMADMQIRTSHVGLAFNLAKGNYVLIQLT
ncbi:hypothetical protein V8C42DRAFT_337755 [Trichoderma barbatum]